MSRPEYTVGNYWLTKRRDGKSPDIWQIATKRARTVVYRSTKCRSLEDAKAVIHSFEADQRSRKPQATEQAELLPHLFNYLREHGQDTQREDTIRSSFRAWIGFLMQDELGTGALVADLNKVSVARFRRWRMGPHEWNVEWGGKVYRHTSKGVSGEAVQRNIEDMRSALNHAEAAGRIPMRPRIPSVDKSLRSPARQHLFTPKQLGAVIAYADHEPQVQQWLLLMLATAARPDAALAFNPAKQVHGNLIDLHPADAPRTDKRNALVPIIAPLRPVLEGWHGLPVKSRKRWWRTMRIKLGIPATHVPKTIRHTVASHLRNAGVPGEQISGLLGHKDRDDSLVSTSERYAHHDPLKMARTVKALTSLWREVITQADAWRADHLLTITDDNNKIVVARNVEND